VDNVKKKDILKFETRRRIYNYILENPSIHLGELVKKLKIPKTTLYYHLKYLEKENFILVKNNEGFRRHYAVQKVSNVNKKLLSILRQEIPCKIMLFMFLHKDYPSQIEISKHLNKHPTTISYHLDKLIENDLIIPYSYRKKTIYRVNIEHEIYDFFIQYKKSLLDDFIPFALDWWEYNIGSKRMEKVIKSTFEIFPHPYYA